MFLHAFYNKGSDFMIDEKELKKEKDYLKAVLYLLEKEIQNNHSQINEYSGDIK